MNEHVYVRIVASAALCGMQLEGLTGHRGVIVEDLSSEGRLVKGYMVLLEESFEGECLWFVPELSVSYE